MSEDHIAGLVQTGVIRSNTMIWREGLPQWVACSEVKPELFAQPQMHQMHQPRHVAPVVGAAATARHTAAMGAAGAARHAPTHQIAGRAQGVATAQLHPAEAAVIREAASVFAKGAGWMKFLGVLSLIAGTMVLLGALFLLVTVGLSGAGAIMALVVVFALFNGGAGAIMIWLGLILLRSAGKAQQAFRTGQKHALFRALADNAKFFKIWGVVALIGLVINVGSAIVVLASGGIAAVMGMPGGSGGGKIDFTGFDNPNNEEPGRNGAETDSGGEGTGESDGKPDSDGFQKVDENGN